MSREDWPDFRAYRQARHAEWYEKNMTALRGQTEFRFAERDTSCLFREAGRPRVDFYPHTGRWRIVGKGGTTKTLSGGARQFLDWYRKQKARVPA